MSCNFSERSHDQISSLPACTSRRR